MKEIEKERMLPIEKLKLWPEEEKQEVIKNLETSKWNTFRRSSLTLYF